MKRSYKLGLENPPPALLVAAALEGLEYEYVPEQGMTVVYAATPEPLESLLSDYYAR